MQITGHARPLDRSDYARPLSTIAHISNSGTQAPLVRYCRQASRHGRLTPTNLPNSTTCPPPPLRLSELSTVAGMMYRPVSGFLRASHRAHRDLHASARPSRSTSSASSTTSMRERRSLCRTHSGWPRAAIPAEPIPHPAMTRPHSPELAGAIPLLRRANHAMA